jgi:hypothetical protein
MKVQKVGLKLFVASFSELVFATGNDVYVLDREIRGKGTVGCGSSKGVGVSLVAPHG